MILMILLLLQRGKIAGYQIWKKEKVFGFWVKQKKFTVPFTDSFFIVLANREIKHITTQNYINIFNLDPRNAKIFITEKHSKKDYKDFAREFKMYRDRNPLYYSSNQGVEINSDRFKAKVFLPAEIPAGNYKLSVYAFKNKEPIAKKEVLFTIKQDSINNDVRYLIADNPLLYACITISIAILVACLASLLFSGKRKRKK